MNMFSDRVWESDYGMILICALVLIFTVVFFWKNNVTNYYCKIKKQPFLLLLILFFTVISCYNGDWWHYKYMVYQYDGLGYSTVLEPFYYVLIGLVHNNYFLFRLIVWGGALILILFTFKRFDIDIYKASFLMFCLFIQKFDYARVSLALACYFWGFSYIAKPICNYQLVSKVLGVIIIVLSINFHRSMIVPIVLTPLILLPINKYTVAIFFLSVPLFAWLISGTLSGLLGQDSLLGSEDLADKVELYYEGNATERTKLSTQFLFWWNLIAYVVTFIVSTIKVVQEASVFRKKNEVHYLYKIVFIILLLAISCYVNDPTNTVFFNRFFYMPFIPLVIIISLFMKNKMLSLKTYKYLLIVGLSPDVLKFSYWIFYNFSPVR